MNQSRQKSTRETKKPKGTSHKMKPQTEYQRTRDAAKARKQKRGLAIFD